MGRALKLICATAALLAAVAIGLVSRDPSLFRVEQVRIVGVPANADPALAASLTRIARGMSAAGATTRPFAQTLARYSLIGRVRLRPTLPHTLVLDVHVRRPVALLDVRGRHTPLGADGRVITGLRTVPREPLILASHSPVGGRVLDARTLGELAVLNAAPAPLHARLLSLRTDAEGIVAHLSRGPAIYFGDASLPHAKWDSAAAVLADRSSRGASYIDVRLPARPAAQVADPATIAGVSGGVIAAGSGVSAVTLPGAGAHAG